VKGSWIRSATASRSSLFSEGARSADKVVARWGAIYQFSETGRQGRFMKVYRIRQGCGVKRVKNGASVEAV